MVQQCPNCLALVGKLYTRCRWCNKYFCEDCAVHINIVVLHVEKEWSLLRLRYGILLILIKIPLMMERKKEKRKNNALIRSNPIILIEWKIIDADMEKEYACQLFWYFCVSEAKIGILTNGIIYRY